MLPVPGQPQAGLAISVWLPLKSQHLGRACVPRVYGTNGVPPRQERLLPPKAPSSQSSPCLTPSPLSFVGCFVIYTTRALGWLGEGQSGEVGAPLLYLNHLCSLLVPLTHPLWGLVLTFRKWWTQPVSVQPITMASAREGLAQWGVGCQPQAPRRHQSPGLGYPLSPAFQVAAGGAY